MNVRHGLIEATIAGLGVLSALTWYSVPFGAGMWCNTLGLVIMTDIGKNLESEKSVQSISEKMSRRDTRNMQKPVSILA